VLVADPKRRVLRLQVLTIVWMTVECIVALGSAWTAQSPALLGFGGDSSIELLSAIIVAGSGKSGPIHSGNSGRSSTKQKR
jgi:hypothetical protein